MASRFGCRRARSSGRNRTPAAVVAVALLAAACGRGDEAPSPSPVVTLAAGSGVGPVACPFGTALVAADLATGAPLWSHCAGSMGGIEALAASESTVLAAEYGEMDRGVLLLGLDAATGAERWRTTVAPFNESYERDAFYADGARAGLGTVVYSVLESGTHAMVGVDLDTGEPRWRVDALGTFVAGHDEEVAIAVGPGAMFETPSDSAQPDLLAVAFDRRTGEIRWRQDRGIHEMGAPWGPRMGDGLFVFTHVDPHAEDAPQADWRWETVALDTATGEQRWRRERGPLLLVSATGETGVGLRPGASPDRFALEGFATASGGSRWTVELTAGWPVVQAAAGSPVVAVALAPLEGVDPGAGGDAGSGSATTVTGAASGAPASVSVYDRESGRLRFSVTGEAEPAGLVDQLVLVAGSDELFALDATDGTLRWSLPFAHPFGTEVQHAAGRVFLSSSSGLGDPPTAASGAGAGGGGPVVNLSTGTELGSFTVAGETVRFVETPAQAGTPYLCVAVGSNTIAAGCLPERDASGPVGTGFTMPTAAMPIALGSGMHLLHEVSLPAGHARPVTVHDASGAIWPSAESTGRDTLYVLDPVPSNGSSNLRESVEVRSPDGTVLIQAGPPGSAPKTYLGDWSSQLADCYRANGADYHAERTDAAPQATPPSTPLPPESTIAAWAACRQFYPAPPAGSGDTQPPEYLECMAAAGWLAPFWFQHLEQWGPASVACGRDPASS